MRSSTLDERLISFVEEPSSDNFLSVRERIVNDPVYAPYSDALQRLELDSESGDANLVLENALPMRPVWMLSPRFHYLTGIAHLHLGHVQAADHAKRFSRACMHGLLQTGDGSADEPFVVTYLSDEYDIMRYLDVTVRHQRIVELDDLQLDVLTSEQDEFWFDVTDLLAANARSALKESQRPIARQA